MISLDCFPVCANITRGVMVGSFSTGFDLKYTCIYHNRVRYPCIYIIILHFTDSPTSPKGRIIHEELYAAYPYEPSKLLAKKEPSSVDVAVKALVSQPSPNFVSPSGVPCSKLQ